MHRHSLFPTDTCSWAWGPATSATLTIAGEFGLVSSGSRVLKRLWPLALAGDETCWFLAPLERVIVLDLTGDILDGQI